ncbi:MAG TPA: tetratricopeptide repeat protein, partial [Kofleriaceae bacterium]|nr:tetratricopeptide repeat protein [Kofleriaceae bacterium]
ERARALVDELVVRDALAERFRGELGRILAPLGDATAAAEAAPAGRQPPLAVERADGGWVVVAREPRAGMRPLRWRTLWVCVDADGLVEGADYADELTGRAVDRLLAHIEREAAPLAVLAAEQAAARVAAAARATLAAGRHLPRGYYLGRDLLGLRDEHTGGRRPAIDHSERLLARAVDLCADGEAERARPLLDRYVATRPDDPEGASDLGLCLLSLGDAESARGHLARAVALEPGNPLHHWNLAAACHRAGRLGGCYLALRAFLARATREEDGEHRRLAESFVAEYERFARLDFAGAAPSSLARADEHLHAGRAHLGAGEVDAGLASLQRAVRLVPAHHVAWTELGLALAESRPTRARRCIGRALAARPDYEPARQAEQRLQAHQRVMRKRSL